MGGPNPIAVAEFHALMMIWGIASSAEMAKYLRLIQILDQTYLKHCAEQSKAANKNN